MRFAFLICLLLCAAPAQAQSVKEEIPFREDTGLTYAEYYIAKGKYTQAIDTASKVIKRHPKSADAYVYRGYSYYRLGETDKAAKNLTRALELNPTHLGAHKYIADIYLDDGKVSRAYEQLQAMRLVCAGMQCEEIDVLERAINAAKAGDKAGKKTEDKKTED